jgi:hypothetical protein
MIRLRAALRLAVILLLAAGGSPDLAAQAAEDLPPLRLDHVPIAVHDVGAAVVTYRDRLGFAIKPGREHANSIFNAHIKFEDGSALELITATEPRDAQAAWYIAALADREGPVALALDGGPVRSLAGRLEGSGIAFSTAKHSYYESLSFGFDSRLSHLFFLVVHRRPPDLPEHLDHASGALRLHAVWIADPDHAAGRGLLERFGWGAGSASSLDLPARRAESVPLERGMLYLVGSANPERRPVIGATVEVRDLDDADASLAQEMRVAAQAGEDCPGAVSAPAARGDARTLAGAARAAPLSACSNRLPSPPARRTFSP